jgi:hypothetical protein
MLAHESRRVPQKPICQDHDAFHLRWERAWPRPCRYYDENDTQQEFARIHPAIESFRILPVALSRRTWLLNDEVCSWITLLGRGTFRGNQGSRGGCQ